MNRRQFGHEHLAVDLTWQGRGLGKALVKDALLRTAAARPIRISGRRESGIAACPALVEFDQRFIQMQILDHRTHLEVEPPDSI